MPGTPVSRRSTRNAIPRSRALPEGLDAFTKLLTKARVAHRTAGTTWKSLAELMSVQDSAKDSLWPFYGLADGGAVALWWEKDEPCVVHVDSEGGFAVIARDFAEFLARIGAGRSGVAELDEDLATVPVASLVSRKVRPRPLGAAATKRFRAFVASHSALQEADPSIAGEALRQEVFAMAKQMLADGLSKTYTPRSAHWAMSFKLASKKGGWQLTYVDYGVWRPVPASYGPTALAARIVAMTRHPDRASYEMSVNVDGWVCVDREKELFLRPAGKG